MFFFTGLSTRLLGYSRKQLVFGYRFVHLVEVVLELPEMKSAKSYETWTGASGCYISNTCMGFLAWERGERLSSTLRHRLVLDELDISPPPLLVLPPPCSLSHSTSARQTRRCC